MSKSKPIQKDPKEKPHHQRRKVKKPITNEQGDPLIKNLNDFVTSIKVSYTSKPIYTGGRIIATVNNIYSTCNGQIIVFCQKRNEVIDTIKYINEQVVNFSVSPDEKTIVTFTQNSMLRVQLLESKKILQSSKLHGLYANDIQFSPDGKYLACAFGNLVHIFTYQNLKRTHSYNPTNSKFAITKIQWHPNPQKLQIISCDLQRNIAIFDYILNKVIAVTESSFGGTDFAVSPSYDILFTINNLELKVYNYKNLQLKNTIQCPQYFESLGIVQSYLFLGGQQSSLFSIQLTDAIKNNTKSLKKHEDSTDNGVAKLMCINNYRKNVGKLLVLSIQQNITILKIQKNNVQSQGFIVGFNDDVIDIKNSKIHHGSHSQIQNYQSPYFVLVTNSCNFKIVNKNTHRMEHLIKGHQNIVLCADYWHPFIATAGKDKVLKLWRINDNTKSIDHLANYNGHSGDIVSLVALPKSKMIATVAEDLTIKLWSMCLEVEHKVQINSAIRTAIAHAKPINAIKSSPNQDLYATCSQDKTIKIWNQFLTNVMTLDGHKKGVWDIAFHPIQRLIISAGGEGMLKGWSLETGECIWSMGQGYALIRCAWLYYNQVVTGSLNGVVKVWDIRKQTSLTYDKHEGKIWALDVDKVEPLKIYTGATDSMYHVWQDNTLQMKKNIMKSHELQEQERIFYDQHMANKRYSEGAIIAFKGGYTKLFMQALQKIGLEIDPDKAVDFDENGKLVIQIQQQEGKNISEQQFQGMVKTLKQIDINRLLINLQAMTSTIKYYKMGNKILLQLLRISSFTQLISLNSKFVGMDENNSLDQFNEKKSNLVKWLASMISYQQKHTTRLNKYIQGTHWIQHKYRQQNPFSRD